MAAVKPSPMDEALGGQTRLTELITETKDLAYP